MGIIPKKHYSVCECMYLKYVITSHELRSDDNNSKLRKTMQSSLAALVCP